MSEIWAKCKPYLKTKSAAVILLAVYIVVGLFLVKDYGIGTDEPVERDTSLITYVYVMGDIMRMSPSESVREVAETTPPLMSYKDRYYGTALSFPMVAIEHMFNFELSSRTIFIIRHAYNFLTYVLAVACFYGILRRRYDKSFVPITGMLLLILYPRFFGESFYNNKDILFFSWCVISAFCVLSWIEKDSFRWLFLAAGTMALACNARILGLMILALGIPLYIVISFLRKKPLYRTIGLTALLLVAFFGVYVAVTPFTWESPIRRTVDIFFHFIHFQQWNGTHFYLGEMITKNVPWHYIPVWIGVTSPTLYIILFITGLVAAVMTFIGILKKRKKIVEWEDAELVRRSYDLFFLLMFGGMLGGFILLKVGIYEGWRHVYSLFLPFLYIAVYGLWWAYDFCRKKKKILSYAVAGGTAVCMLLTAGWIVRTHPYEYAYFNLFARPYAENNFAIDYWGISHMDLQRAMLAQDDREKIVVSFYPRKTLMLTDEEQSHLEFVKTEHSPDYYIQISRIHILERAVKPGYEEIGAIEVDGYKISTLYRTTVKESDFEAELSDKIKSLTSSETRFDYRDMLDDTLETRWKTDLRQSTEQWIQFEFDETVSYNFLRMAVGQDCLDDYVRALKIETSLDGENWQDTEILWNNWVDYLLPEGEYRFIRLSSQEASEDYRWSISEIRFGNVDPELYLR